MACRACLACNHNVRPKVQLPHTWRLSLSSHLRLPAPGPVKTSCRSLYRTQGLQRGPRKPPRKCRTRSHSVLSPDVRASCTCQAGPARPRPPCSSLRTPWPKGEGRKRGSDVQQRVGWALKWVEIQDWVGKYGLLMGQIVLKTKLVMSNRVRPISRVGLTLTLQVVGWAGLGQGFFRVVPNAAI